jgi:uncharacterized protein YdhG (YjbR/CyaY superfamily)
MNAGPADMDAYLAALPEDARATLETLRRVVRAAVPEAVETISYGMPTFKYSGKWLFYFAAAKKHCAIYGTPRGTLRFPPGAAVRDHGEGAAASAHG